MNNSQMLLALLIGAALGVWIYAIGLAIYLLATSNWFARTWFGQALSNAWNLMAEVLRTISPTHKREQPK